MEQITPGIYLTLKKLYLFYINNSNRTYFCHILHLSHDFLIFSFLCHYKNPLTILVYIQQTYIKLVHIYYYWYRKIKLLSHLIHLKSVDVMTFTLNDKVFQIYYTLYCYVCVCVYAICT